MEKKSLIFLLIILLIASFFRLWALDLIPPGLYPDEAINGNEALDSLESKNFKIFYPENNGREGLFIWLLALSFYILGPGIGAIKIVPAIIGILTVLGLYLLSRELLSHYPEARARSVALLSSFFLAVSFWHINFSRIGFRAILVPFILVFGFYFLFKGFRQKKLLNFIISGLFLASGFYTYISYRFVVLLGIIVLIFWWLVYKKQNLQKQFLLFTACCLLLIVILALPIGIYFLNNPGDFFGRATGVSIFAYENPIFQFAKSLILHLSMFNFYGDANWRHNFSGSPQLLWLVGIFFLIGFILSIKDLISSLKNKNHFLPDLHFPGWQVGARFITSCFLISWFLIMLLPGFLSAEGAPHALRVIGVIPVVYLFAGMGADWLFKKIKPFYKTKRQTIIFYLFLSILFITIVYGSFDKYFFQWAKNPNVAGAFSKNYLEIGNYLNSLPNDVSKYLIVNQSGVLVPLDNGIPMPAQTPIFIERTVYKKPRATYLLPEDLNKIKIEKQGVIVPLEYDENLFLELSRLFPSGNLEEIKEGVWVYEINP